MVFRSKELSDVNLPSAGVIVPDSELKDRLRSVRGARMRGMVPENLLMGRKSCVSFVEATRADGIVPESEL